MTSSVAATSVTTNSLALASTLTGSSIILSGNVGIGTASSSEVLEVYKNNGVGTVTQMNITSWAGAGTTTNQSILNLKVQGAGGGSVDNTIIGQYSSSGNTYRISFNPIGVNVMNVLGNGNVGIGTASPSSALHVVGNITQTQTVYNSGDLNIPSGSYISINITSFPNGYYTVYYYIGSNPAVHATAVLMIQSPIRTLIVSSTISNAIISFNNSTLSGGGFNLGDILSTTSTVLLSFYNNQPGTQLLTYAIYKIS